jgi:hypothetical protein
MGICILGMGDCTSRNTTDISDITRNDIDINNSIKNSIEQNCNQTALEENTINIIGSNVKSLSATQKNSLESMCILQSILKSTTNADVVNNLMNKVRENLKSEGGLLGSPASNDTVVRRLSENSSKVDNSKFNEISKDCIMNMKQTNLLNIIGSNIEDTTTDQANAAFLKCLSQHSDDTAIDFSVLSDTKNETETEKTAASGDVGKSVGSAAKGIGEGVASGIGGIISTFIIPIVIFSIILILVSFASSFLMISNPQSTQQLAGTASQIYQQYKTQ